MNVLLTGAEGFIGKNLVELFKKDIEYNLLSPTLKELDLTSINDVKNYFNKNKIDFIIHSATTLRNKTSYPDDVCERNLKMFFNLVKCAKKDTKIINFGSGSEYSREHWIKNMSEDYFDKFVPMDSHSYAKYLISKYIEDSKDSKIISLRIFGIFGEYEDYKFKFISNAIAKNISNLPIVINQNVDYDYLYVKDFYSVLKIFINKWPEKYKTYNITPDQSICLTEVAQIINSIGNYKSDILLLNEGIGTNYSGSNKRLLEEIPNFRFMTYEESIRDLYNYFLNNKQNIDIEALKKDDFLSYAKTLKKDYFDKSNENKVLTRF